MAELLWESLIISITLLFGINIGLALGLTNMYKKEALTVSILYGLIVLILGMTANLLKDLLYGVLDPYISVILGIIGLLTLLGGIYTVDKWNKTKQDYYPFASTAIITSSICYFLGFVSLAVLLSREITISFLGFSLIIAIVLGVSLIISYLFSKILRNAESPYSVLLGNFMILNGFYCLICAFFVPNIGTLELTQMNPISIDSSFYMIFLIMAAFGVFLVGVYLRQEGITSLKDLYQRKSASKSDKIEKIS